MKVSGFYMVTADTGEAASKIALKRIKEEILSSNHPDFVGSTCEIVEALIYSEDYIDGKSEFDVHFLIDMPSADLEEDTDEFSELEKFVGSGLWIVTEDDDY